jgi:alpha-acetolactate decarboxylase
MDITQVKLDFKSPPFLRKADLIAKQAVNIIILSENQSEIDIGLLHKKHQDEGQPGLRYHYVIKNNGQYDGAIYYCRPRIYQNGIPGDNPTGENMVNNSISICLAGLYGDAATNKQVASCVDLCIMLLTQEALPLSHIIFYQEIPTGSNNKIANSQDIKDAIKTKLEGVNLLKTLLVDPTSSGVTDVTAFEQDVSKKDFNSFALVAKYYDIPVDVVASMNKHITTPDNIPYDTVIYIPANPQRQKLRALQQNGTLNTIRAQIDEQIKVATIERGKYGQPNTGEDLYGQDLTFLTTQYGGKKQSIWQVSPMEFPGYHNAFIQFTNNTTNNVATTIPFMISPSSSSESRSTSQQMSKTNAGWFIMRTGKNPGTMNISGYMLDIKNALERHQFLENYKKYIEDIKNERLEFTNEYSTKLRVEGRDYYGYIQSISFTKSAVQPFLYQYNITLVVLNDKMIYDPRYAAQSLESVNSLLKTGTAVATVSPITKIMAPAMYNAFNEIQPTAPISLAPTSGSTVNG